MAVVSLRADNLPDIEAAHPTGQDDLIVNNPVHHSSQRALGSRARRTNTLWTALRIRSAPLVTSDLAQNFRTRAKTRIIAHSILAFLCFLPLVSLFDSDVRRFLSSQMIIFQDFAYTGYVMGLALSILNGNRMWFWRSEHSEEIDNRVNLQLKIGGIRAQDMKTVSMSAAVATMVFAVGVGFSVFRGLIYIDSTSACQN